MPLPRTERGWAWLACAAACGWAGAAMAEPAGALTDLPQAAPMATPAVRPAISANRWAEDWSVLADPALRTNPFDAGKYIPLLPADPNSYVSLGITLRERWEMNTAPALGIGANHRDSYLLQRFQPFIDLHVNENLRAFVQLEDDRAWFKHSVSSVDRDPLDLRLAFLEYDGQVGPGLLKTRVGRQDFQFDLQRFISSRDGPNVRQSFDAVWVDYELPEWRVIALASRPVQYQDGAPFNDVSNHHLQFDMLRLERLVFCTDELSAYYALYQRDGARFLDAMGNERRHVIDARFAGGAAGFDWDLEAMGQTGSVGTSSILAWAAGSRAGYTFAALPWAPRLGLQADAASGDTHPGDGRIGTFNPLFPNGYYFALSGYTGYANLFHLKPSITVSPAPGLKVAAGIGLQWRMTTHDAVYVQSLASVPRTAGQGSAWTGGYAQLRADYAFTPNLAGAIEAVRYQVGRTLQQAGLHDASYIGVEMKLSW